ncbi:MAG: ribonuclease J [Ruthenibacterium sp.]
MSENQKENPGATGNVNPQNVHKPHAPVNQNRQSTQKRPAQGKETKAAGTPAAQRVPAAAGLPAAPAAPAVPGAATTAQDGQRTRRGYRPRRRKPQEQNGPAAPQIHLYPLGGLGEVGKNITVYECNGDMLLVDCGLVFPDSDMFGIDLVIPDFTFVLQNKERIKGVVITHGHEDHIGSLPYLLKEFNVPIYATRLTIGLIQNKLEEHGLRASTKFIEIQPRKKFKLGCFTIEPIHVNHSIPDAVALAIDSPAGVVLQTGDFKIDYTPLSGGPTDLATIGNYGQSGVLALLSDSTNAERPGFTATEHKVSESFATLFNRAEKQRIIIATFASNLYRVQQIIDMAVAKGRKVAVSGRSMVNNTEMAKELGYLHAPETALIDIDQLNKYPPEKIVLITTGSQGEPLSALSRMSSGSHRSVHVGKGDFIIISANPIPGNEKMVTKVVNGLLKLGAEVIYESMYDVHVSGHACQEEQKLMLTLANPQFFLPVHGEYKQLKKHAITAASLGIPEKNIYIGENGDHIILSRDGITMGESVTAGAVMVDGLGVGDVGNIVLRDRRHLSEDGLVIVVATVDKATGQVLSGPDIVTRGFVYVRESETLLEETCAQVQNLLDRLDGADMRDWNSVKTRIRETVSAYLYRRTKRSPMILPILMEV